MSDQSHVTVSQICKKYTGSRGAPHLNPSTVTRWILEGCKARDGNRIRLAATRVGSRWLVRPADLDTFFAALAAEPASGDSTDPTPTQPSASRAAAAAKELARRGA